MPGKRSRPIVVYFHGAFVHRQNGAHARVLDLLRFVVELSDRVVLYSYTNHVSNPWGAREIELFRREFPQVRLVLEKRSAWLKLFARLKAYLIAVFPQLSAWLLTTAIPGLTPAFDALLSEPGNPLLLVNYALGMTELNGLRGKPVVIETHDLQFLNATKSLNRRLSDLKSMVQARLEIELLNSASALIAIAIPEAKMFRLFFPKMPIYFIPTYGHQVQEQVTFPQTHRYDLLFVGSENAHNVEGLCDFINTYRRWLIGRRFAIAGRICMVPRLRDTTCGLDSIDLLGYVDDLESLFRASKIVLSPVDGTGQKIKIIDAMAAGKPVFGSRHSLEALPPGFENCAFPLTTSGMEALLADDEARHRAERAARVYFKGLTNSDDLDAFRSYLMNTTGPAVDDGTAQSREKLA